MYNIVPHQGQKTPKLIYKVKVPGACGSCKSQMAEEVLIWHSHPEGRGWRQSSAGDPDSWQGWGSQWCVSSVWWWGSSFCPVQCEAPESRPCSCPQSGLPMSPGSHMQVSTWPLWKEIRRIVRVRPAYMWHLGGRKLFPRKNLAPSLHYGKYVQISRACKTKCKRKLIISSVVWQNAWVPLVSWMQTL